MRFPAAAGGGAGGEGTTGLFCSGLQWSGKPLVQHCYLHQGGLSVTDITLNIYERIFIAFSGKAENGTRKV